MKVDAKKIKEVLDFLEEIDKQELKDIKWTLDNKEIKMPDGVIRFYKFTGLSNSQVFKVLYSEEDGDFTNNIDNPWF